MKLKHLTTATKVVKYALLAAATAAFGLTTLITFMERNEEPYDR